MNRYFTIFLILLTASFKCVNAQTQEQNARGIANDIYELLSDTSELERGVQLIQNNESQLPEIIQFLNESLSPKDSLFHKLSRYRGYIADLSPQVSNRISRAVIPLARDSKDTLALTEALLDFSESEMAFGRFDSALEGLLEAITYVSETKYPDLYKSALNRTAINYLETEEYTLALKFYNQLEDFALRTQDESTLAIVYNNSALIFFDIDSVDKAEEYYLKVLEFEGREGFEKIVSYTLGNLAELCSRSGRLEEALDYQIRCMEIEKYLNDNLSIIDSQAVLAHIYFQMGDLERFKFHLGQSEQLAVEINALDKLLDVYLLGMDDYGEIEEFEKAFQYSVNYQELKDSLFTVEKSAQLAEMREKYETEQKEAAILNLQIDNQTARNRNLVLTIVAIAVMVIAGFGFGLYRQSQKRKKEVEERNKLITSINEELKTSQNALMESNKLKDRFFALVAHDLRGPITSFQGIGQMLEFMMKKGNPERVAELVKSIDQSAQGVNTLLDNLLKWSLNQTGTLSFNPEQVQVNAILTDILSIYQQSAQAKGIRLIKEVPDEVRVMSDHNMLSTIFRNLVGNALKFTREDGDIKISINQIGNQYEFLIADTGVGIPSEKLQSIFELSENKSTKGTQGEKGTGLGLMLCKEFVEKNQGQIQIESTKGKGTTVIFSLPAIIDEPIAV